MFCFLSTLFCYFCAFLTNLRSKIPDPSTDPKSKIQDPRSKIQNHRFQIQDTRSQLPNPWSQANNFKQTQAHPSTPKQIQAKLSKPSSLHKIQIHFIFPAISTVLLCFVFSLAFSVISLHFLICSSTLLCSALFCSGLFCSAFFNFVLLFLCFSAKSQIKDPRSQHRS